MIDMAAAVKLNHYKGFKQQFTRIGIPPEQSNISLYSLQAGIYHWLSEF